MKLLFFLFHRQKKIGRKIGRKIGLMVNLENWRLISYTKFKTSDSKLKAYISQGL